jgi:hypothetical protein
MSFSFFLQVTLSFYIGFLLFEDFPTSVIICGIISQVAHLFILKTFPFVVIASPAFIIAIIMLIINHYLAFQYFAAVYYSFSEVCSLFISMYIISYIHNCRLLIDISHIWKQK